VRPCHGDGVDAVALGALDNRSTGSPMATAQAGFDALCGDAPPVLRVILEFGLDTLDGLLSAFRPRGGRPSPGERLPGGPVA
jgi:hypothetical protein